MSSLVDIFRRLVIAPEFVVVLVAAFFVYLEPEWVIAVSELLGSAPDGVKYIAIVPVGLFIWCIRQSRQILFPSEDVKGILQEWPRFSTLKTRVLLGVFYQVLFSISGVGAWLASPNLSSPTAVVFLAMAIIGSFVGAVTFYLASIMVREITKRFTTNS